MANLSITAANVLAGNGANTQIGVAAVAITQGQALYIDPNNSNKLNLADANGTAPANTFAGIALNAASAGQPVSYNVVDPAFTLGATVASGDTVYLSDTPGALTVTQGDLASGSTIIVVGVATSTTVINLRPVVGGVK